MSKWKEMQAAEAELPESNDVPGEDVMAELEAGFKEDLDEALASFMDRRERERKRFTDIVDSNFYFTVYFTNFSQLVEFCREFGLNPDMKYFDGREIAKAFRKALKTPDTKIPRERGRTKEYAQRAMKP